MTNFIEKLKQVAAGRNRNDTNISGWINFTELADNCFDELVACAETLALYARNPNDGRTRAETVPMIDDYDGSGPARRALTALRKKVDAEGV